MIKLELKVTQSIATLVLVLSMLSPFLLLHTTSSELMKVAQAQVDTSASMQSNAGISPFPMYVPGSRTDVSQLPTQKTTLDHSAKAPETSYDGLPSNPGYPINRFTQDDFDELQPPYGAWYPSAHLWTIYQGGNSGIVPGHTPENNWSHQCSLALALPNCGAIDIGLVSGTPIYSVDSGTVRTVVALSPENNFGPWLVIIQNDNSDTYAMYAHLSSVDVTSYPPQHIEQGQRIGLSGASVDSSGSHPHLHFGITQRAYDYNNDRYVYIPINLRFLPGLAWNYDPNHPNDPDWACTNSGCGTASGIPEFFPEPNYQPLDAQQVKSQSFAHSRSTLVGTRIGNDSIESLRVPSGYSVTIYEHSIDQGLGRSLRFDGPISVSDLATVGSVNLSNKVSSLAICRANDCPPVASQVLCVAPTAIATPSPCTNSIAYTRIQDAINSAQSGAEIRIAAGTYRGSPNYQSGVASPYVSNVVTLTKNVVIVGGYSTNDWTSAEGPNLTVLDGQGSTAVEIQGTNSPAIQNLTISNGSIENNNGTVHVYAGSLYISSGSANGHLDIGGGSELNVNGTLQSGTSITGYGLLSGNPTLAGPVSVNNLTVVGGNLNVAAPLTVRNLSVSGGSISGSGTITVTGSMNWTGGRIAAGGGATISPGATLNISGSTHKYLSSTLNNQGTVTWTGTGDLYMQDNNPTINNSGLFDVQNDQRFLPCGTYWCDYTGHFNNSGTFRKSVGSGTTEFLYDMIFNSTDTGTVQVESGTLSIPSQSEQSVSSGSFNVSLGATLQFTGGIYGLASSASLNGAGTVYISGSVIFTGTHTITPTLMLGGALIATGGTLSIRDVSMDAGGLYGNGGTSIINITGTMNWSGGRVQGATLNIAPGATLNISGSTHKYLSSTLNNQGTVTWTGTGDLYMQDNNPTINNSGLFDVQNDQRFLPCTQFQCSYTGHFNNSGTFRKSAGSGTTEFSSEVIVNNSGTIQVQTGTVYLTGSLSGGEQSTSNGHFEVASGSTLGFYRHNLEESATLSGAGTVSVHGLVVISGTHTITPSMSVQGSLVSTEGALTIHDLNMSSGGLGGTGVINITGTMNWSGGRLNPGGLTTIAPGATLNISGSTHKYLSSTLNNQGTVTWTGTGDLYMQDNNPTINNSGLFDVQNDQRFLPCGTYWCDYTGHFNNSGTFRKSVGSGTTEFLYDTRFTNNGTVQVQSGTLNLGSNYMQNNGSLLLSGGDISGGTLNLNGGTLQGTGTVTANIVNRGQISPGSSAGILTITGNYIQSPTGTLTIEIGGTTPGTHYDRLQVNGMATLSGTLNISTINGFAPTPSDTFQVLTYASRVGSSTFSSITGLALPNGNSYTPTYNSNNFTLGVRGPNVLRGHITWQGRPSQPHALNQMPITLTLTFSDTNYSYPALTTDGSGYFTATVGTLPNGVYNWWVKGPQHLASSGTVALGGAPTTNQEMGLMRAGDVNNDNIVDISDFSILRGTFGKACGDTGYNGNADFTGDCIVDISDFSLLRGNFGQSGASQPTRAGTKPQQDISSKPSTQAGSAYLELRPKGKAPSNGGSVKVGEKFVLELWVNSGSHTDLVGQQSYLAYTHQLLQNVQATSSNATCTLTSTVAPDTTVFDAILQNEVCNGSVPCSFRGLKAAPGAIAFASGLSPDTTTVGIGSFRVAQISMCAITAGEAKLHWQLSSDALVSPRIEIVSKTGLPTSNPNLFANYVINVVAGAR